MVDEQAKPASTSFPCDVQVGLGKRCIAQPVLVVNWPMVHPGQAPRPKAVHRQKSIVHVFSHVPFLPHYLLRRYNGTVSPFQQHRPAYNVRSRLENNIQLWSGSKWDLFLSHERWRFFLFPVSRYSSHLTAYLLLLLILVASDTGISSQVQASDFMAV